MQLKLPGMLHRRSTLIATLLLLAWASALLPKALFACDLISERVQSSCCCQVRETGCERGGDCKGHTLATTTDCCNISYTTSMAAALDDQQALFATKSWLPELPALLPGTHVSFIVDTGRSPHRRHADRFRPAGNRLYFIAARIRE